MGFMDFLKSLFGDAGRVGEGACIACEATDLTELAPQTYLCNVCGYEGGDGHAAYLEDRERVKLRELDVSELKKRAIKLLQDARFTLLAAISGNMKDDGRTPFDEHDGGSERIWDFASDLLSTDLLGVDVELNIGWEDRDGPMAEERARIAAERREGIATAAQELMALRPVFDVLEEKGVEMAEHKRRLEEVTGQETPPLEKLKTFIVNAGKRIDT